MKKLLFFNLMLLTVVLSFAQQKSFDIVSYSAPENWVENQSESKISYSRIDGKNWAQIVIYAHRNFEVDIQSDFDKDWNELVSPGKLISSPEKSEPQSIGGWSMIRGSGVWQYNGSTVTSVLSVYSNNKVSVAVLCNSTAANYLNIYKSFNETFRFSADNENTEGVQNPPAGNGQVENSISVVGIWVVYQRESSGFVNGHLLYTGGYMRKEYQLKQDGTYIFREKNWLVNNDAIYFVYESGTWKINGNQLTFVPGNGKAGWWNKDKAGHDVNKWGSFKKAASYKLQTATYSYEIKVDPNYSNAIVLNSEKATQRDGGQFNSAPFRFVYVFNKESSIDYPPGFKTLN